MNYTVPTLIILLITAGAYFSRKRLPIAASRSFEKILAVTIITIVADFVSTKMDMAGGLVPNWAMWLFNYLFFALFLLRSYMLFWFPRYLIHIFKYTRFTKLLMGIEVAEQVFLLIGSICGWIFSIRTGIYVSGPMYEFINIQFILWILLGFTMLIRTRHHAKIRKGGIYAYFTVLLIGILIRTFAKHIVVMNLFCMLAIQIIYLMYLNPDQYIDDATAIFNNKGWNKVLDEAYQEKGFNMVGFGFCNYLTLCESRGEDTIHHVLRQTGDWIRHLWPHIPAFYLGNGIFILADIKPLNQEMILDDIRRRFSLPWGSKNGEYYIRINELRMEALPQPVSSEILRGAVFDTYDMLTNPETEQITIIDKSFLQKYVRQAHVQSILSDALNNDGLEMFLQPIVDAKTGHVEGAEALCRLPNGEGGYIFPDEFIHLAMETGSMGKLGIQMFTKACAFMSQEAVRFSNLKWVNVNLAPEQFRNPNLLNELLSILHKYDLTPDTIHLEITEETMIDRSLLHDTMTRFNEEGFLFAMDDFGSSYSNMIRLQQNHFTSVKIDKDFTWSYFRNKTALLPDIIHTCHDLDIKIVVEGVETGEMVEGIREIHGDYIQGYYYSKPIPADAFLEKFVTRNEAQM